jgi:hypothetical protein
MSLLPTLSTPSRVTDGRIDSGPVPGATHAPGSGWKQDANSPIVRR